MSAEAILVVSFGTSCRETRAVTIDAIEQEIGEAFPHHSIYRAWTSKKIIRALKEREGIHINDVAEAMEEMLSDGITDVLVQPTYVAEGAEYQRMKEEILAYQGKFHGLSLGTPLLGSAQDLGKVILAVTEEFSDLKAEEALVLMGHGTWGSGNDVYGDLDVMLKKMGFQNIFLGTMKQESSAKQLIQRVEEYGARKVVLAPFMIVAGKHARRDLAGDDPKSWESQFQAAGFQTEVREKGLGQYPGIRKIFVEHLKEIYTEDT